MCRDFKLRSCSFQETKFFSSRENLVFGESTKKRFQSEMFIYTKTCTPLKLNPFSFFRGFWLFSYLPIKKQQLFPPLTQFRNLYCFGFLFHIWFYFLTVKSTSKSFWNIVLHKRHYAKQYNLYCLYIALLTEFSFPKCCFYYSYLELQFHFMSNLRGTQYTCHKLCILNSGGLVFCLEEN